MEPREYIALQCGQPVTDAQGRPCVVTAKSPWSDSLLVAYGDGEELGAVFESFGIAAPGSVQWDGERWVLA
jgi:hypothetical protein